ncbi:hypothetical protein R1sor_017385 [Riccia sorocarpa]|uniref:GDSL esterase/lipase n=1 Tax=Riccia sorocarpa TaxID=122646 RepID=A0ABD3I6P5_9MARC
MGRSRTTGYEVVLVGNYRLPLILSLLSFTALLGPEFGPVPVLGLAEQCPSGIFSFGDSLSDTGSRSNAFPGVLHSDYPPYGEQFFGKPSKRICNGRLVLDFFALAFGRKPLLQPYIQTGPYDYRFGVNFAFSGATASGGADSTPINLAAQILQFLKFKKDSDKLSQDLEFCALLGCSPDDINLPTKEVYENALYTLEFGGNDIINSVIRGGDKSYVIGQVIPTAMNIITASAEKLYESGARRFLFFATPNAGCATILMTLFGETAELDSTGCVKIVNDYNRAYNAALRSVVAALRLQFADAQMDIFDYYAANEEILKNPTAYGFNPEKTMTACCGVVGAGKYNFDLKTQCGNPAVPMCANPDEYVNWDGVHFTEQFYRTIARFVLVGKFSDLGINYTAGCDLDFNLFNSSVTYDQAYPPASTCSIPKLTVATSPYLVM